MITTAGIVAAALERGGQTQQEAIALLDSVPAWQWRAPGGWWPELSAHCQNRIDPTVERRRCNGLNVEISAPSPRCLRRSPDGLGLRWFMSGGSVLAYGICDKRRCWRCNTKGNVMMEKISEIEADIETEETLGSEDRLFADMGDQPLWYWQARGTSDCNGPFASREEAICDYEKA